MAFTELWLEKLLEKWLLDRNLDCENIKVCRKRKDLRNGDFVVPRGVLKIDSNIVERSDLEAKVQEATAHGTLPIGRVSCDNHNAVIFFVNRTNAFRNIIEEVISSGDKYGHRNERNQSVIVNPVDLNLHDIAANDHVLVSTTQLRAAILLKHVLLLLAANGYTTEVSKISSSSKVVELLNTLRVKASEQAVPLTEQDWDPLVEEAKASKWRETLETAKCLNDLEEVNPEASIVLKSVEPIILNIRNVIDDEHLPTGRHGYDKNLHLVEVIQGSGAASTALMEAAFINRLVPRSDDKGDEVVSPAIYCIHLVSQPLAFSQQQADLLLRACSPSSRCLQQRHLVFGTVGSRKSSAVVIADAEEFYNLRYNQMTQAAMMKYGDHEQGPGWQDMIDGLTAASITFEMLTTVCGRPVLLDLAEDDLEKGVDNRSGPFVLYNCARLATLLQSFQDRVAQGVYPELPDASKIDFSLLREEEEWSIAFLYLNAFPQLVQDAGSNWQENEGMCVNLSTHKCTYLEGLVGINTLLRSKDFSLVVHFLLSFSKTLSSYYSRYHILGGSEEHLLPLMFARLSLIKAAHQVLCNGLRLLGLQPFSQL